jgi:23S rRNA pseudouridine2604 synthase
MSDFDDELPSPDGYYANRVRLNKFLAERGICSRRDADLWIESGRVTLNNEIVDVGAYVDEDDQVRVDGELISITKKPKKVYIALHKPIGIECTTDQTVEGNIVDFVGHQERIFPIGRLDKDSDGLILLTNDGEIVNKILRSEHNHDKEYLVTVDHKISAEFLSGMANGVRILRRLTKPCKTFKVATATFGIVLTEGMNRQIRKMAEAFGYRVLKLTRVRIMNISLGHIRPGRWRNLTPVELAGLRASITAPKAAEERAKPRGRGKDGLPVRVRTKSTVGPGTAKLRSVADTKAVAKPRLRSTPDRSDSAAGKRDLGAKRERNLDSRAKPFAGKDARAKPAARSRFGTDNKSRRPGDTAEKSRRPGGTAEKSRRLGGTEGMPARTSARSARSEAERAEYFANRAEQNKSRRPGGTEDKSRRPGGTEAKFGKSALPKRSKPERAAPGKAASKRPMAQAKPATRERTIRQSDREKPRSLLDEWN